MNKLISLAILFLPFGALAEVSDKISTVSELWLHGFIFGCIMYFLVLWHISFVLLALSLLSFFVFTAFDTLNDPHVGAAIIREQGASYIVALYSVPVVIGICTTFAVIKSRRELKRGKYKNLDS